MSDERITATRPSVPRPAAPAPPSSPVPWGAALALFVATFFVATSALSLGRALSSLQAAQPKVGEWNNRPVLPLAAVPRWEPFQPVIPPQIQPLQTTRDFGKDEPFEQMPLPRTNRIVITGWIGTNPSVQPMPLPKPPFHHSPIRPPSAGANRWQK